MQFLKHIKVKRIETRSDDFWYDMSIHELRKGPVSFYSVKDFLTGEWLFKVCTDKEKITVKALKCPPGIRFSQLEGKTMLFQQSRIEGMLYDVISLSEIDTENRLRRNVISSMKELPAVIKENFKIRSYEEVTGKKAPGKYLVTLNKPDNEKELVILFVLERGWSLSVTTPEEELKKMKQIVSKKKETKKEIDTKQDLSCSICGKKHRLIHVETERAVKHVLRNPNSK